MERASNMDDPTPRCKDYLKGIRCLGCNKQHRFPWQDDVLCDGNKVGKCDYGSKCWFYHNPPLPKNVLPPEPGPDDYVDEPLAVTMRRLLSKEKK